MTRLPSKILYHSRHLVNKFCYYVCRVVLKIMINMQMLTLTIVNDLKEIETDLEKRKKPLLN